MTGTTIGTGALRWRLGVALQRVWYNRSLVVLGPLHMYMNIGTRLMPPPGTAVVPGNETLVCKLIKTLHD